MEILNTNFMDGKEYALQEFCLLLKLGVWQSGMVAGWGRVEIATVAADDITGRGFFIRKPMEMYRRSPLIKKQLGLGLFLLDSYCLTRTNTAKESIHIAVIAVCRATIDRIEALYCLRITNRSDSLVESFDSSGRHYFRKRKTVRASNRIDTSPLNSYTRKY
ncbi:MAG: hypothetical protein LBB85_05075 [Dysgonamonadaceae bacterium]|jgi:hypothetical protein|nr:hypothetical protein [Dysgonamonadaceae bacterium]